MALAETVAAVAALGGRAIWRFARYRVNRPMHLIPCFVDVASRLDEAVIVSRWRSLWYLLRGGGLVGRYLGSKSTCKAKRDSQYEMPVHKIPLVRVRFVVRGFA